MISESSGLMSLVSLLAQIDGGVPMKTAGVDNKITGDAFLGTAFGSQRTYTPLITTHSANDHLYGYPSALLGTLIPMLGIPGFLDLPLADKLVHPSFAALGQYSAGFQNLCAANCADPNPALGPYGFLTCTGKVADRGTLEGAITAGVAPATALMFADNECAPLGWTHSTKYFCGLIEQSVTDLLVEQCKSGVAEQVHAGAPGGSTWSSLTEEAQNEFMAAHSATIDSTLTSATAAGGYGTNETAYCIKTVLAGLGAQGMAATYGAGYSVALVGGVQQVLISTGVATSSDVTTVYSSLTAAQLSAYEDAVHITVVATGLNMTNPSTQTHAAIVEAYANSLGIKYCTCADGTHGAANMPVRGCCLADGKSPDQDFTGFGCLYGAPGWYETGTDRNSGLDLGASMARSKVVKTGSASSPPVTSTIQYCPATPDGIAQQVAYEDATSHVTSRNGETQPVTGGNAQFFAPKGLTAKAGDNTVSAPGTNVGSQIELWVKQVLRQLPLEYQGDGTLHGLKLAKYSPSPNLLKGGDAWDDNTVSCSSDLGCTSADVDVGRMADGSIGFDGAQYVGVVQGGLPFFLMMPNFLHGYTDGDSSTNLLDPAVNDAELYHCFDYNAEDPTTLVAPVTGNTWDLSGCTKMDLQFLADKRGDLEVDVLVEPR